MKLNTYITLFLAVQIIGFFIGKDMPSRNLKFLESWIKSYVVRSFYYRKCRIFSFFMEAYCQQWPSIFSLSIKNLGKYTSQGSSFLVMMILGGAIIPPIQGKLQM